MSLPASEKEALLARRMDILRVNETDLEETPAGAVGLVLLHHPSGLFVKCQATPDKAQNRLIALRLLLDKVEKWQKSSRAERQTINRAASLFFAILAGALAVLLYLLFRHRVFEP